MIRTFVVSIEDLESPRLTTFFGQFFFKKYKPDEITVIGVKGGELSAKEYFNLAVHGRQQPLSPGELGCSLSHLEIYKQFLSTDQKLALIFEDDAILPESLVFEDLCNQLIALELKPNFLFSLGGIQLKVCLNVRGKFIESKFFSKNVLQVNKHFYERVCYTFAYVIDREMAKTLINYHEKVRRADDWSYLYDFDKNAKIFMTNLIDHPVEQTQDTSYLELERKKKKDIHRSIYGRGLSKELAKIQNTKYS